MDYLTFGLLAGSVIVIASFLLRDAAPHLTALSPTSPLGRLSRRETPLAWGRWCADAGLVVSAAGTLVLLATVGALVADVADGVGTVVVALALTAALVGAGLALARLSMRYRDDVATELTGASIPRPAASAPRRAPTIEPVAASPASPSATPRAERVSPHVPAPDASVQPLVMDEAEELWDDDLPTWSDPFIEAVRVGMSVDLQQREFASPVVPEVGPRSQRKADARAALAAEDDHPPEHHRSVPAPVVSPTVEWRHETVEARPVDPIGGEPAATVIGGSFSSPLLADIGLPAADEATEGFRSRLLLDLDRPLGDGTLDDAAAGSDILLDESPAPAFPSARGREELS